MAEWRQRVQVGEREALLAAGKTPARFPVGRSASDAFSMDLAMMLLTSIVAASLGPPSRSSCASLPLWPPLSRKSEAYATRLDPRTLPTSRRLASPTTERCRQQVRSARDNDEAEGRSCAEVGYTEATGCGVRARVPRREGGHLDGDADRRTSSGRAGGRRAWVFLGCKEQYARLRLAGRDSQRHSGPSYSPTCGSFPAW